jgi:ATP-dependent RNA helicase RhlE
MKKKNLMVTVLSNEKSKRIKSQSCGPGVTKKKTHGSVNRNMLKRGTKRRKIKIRN